MKFLLDMNVSPEWKPVFAEAGQECRHWSEVGDPRADDIEIVGWAIDRDFIVVTHDLDFGTILFHTKSAKPSVIQIRGDDLSVAAMKVDVLQSLKVARSDLEAGSLLTIQSGRHRLRVLPFA